MAKETKVKQATKEEEVEELAVLPEEEPGTEMAAEQAPAEEKAPKKKLSRKLSLRKRRKKKKSLKKDSTQFLCQELWFVHQRNVLHVPCNLSKSLSPST